MAETNVTSADQLESMRREGRISQDEYARLRDALAPRPPEERDARDYRRLRKSWSDRELGGVCGGIAQYFGVSSTRIRLAFLLLLLLTGGTAMAIYLALYLVLPWADEERDRILHFPWKFATAVLVLFVMFLFLTSWLLPQTMEVSKNVGSELPAPVRFLMVLSALVTGPGMVGIGLSLVAMVGIGAALSRHGRAYGVYVRIVVGLLVVLLTLLTLTLTFFLLAVA